jgi:ribosomal-protein-alanine N-acetyltransferase
LEHLSSAEPMSLPPFVTEAPGYFTYRPLGYRVVPEAIDAMIGTLATLRDLGATDLLVDIRGLVHLPDLSITERLELGERGAKAGAGKVRVAYLSPERLLHPDRIAGVVATNRGLKLGVFTDEVAALDWLIGPEAIRPVFETERLALRWLTRADAAFIQELVNQPSWLRNIGERNVRSPEDAVGYIEKGPRASYALHGFGLWCVVRKEDGVPLGICGLIKRDHLDHPDIGFAYLERFQGRGYGTEAAIATMEHARGTLGVPRILAVVDPANGGSISILRKLGMTDLGPIQMPGDGAPIALYGPPG